MSPMEADADALIAAGYGSHSRAEIPNDWQTKKGPDEIAGVKRRHTYKPPTIQELRKRVKESLKHRQTHQSSACAELAKLEQEAAQSERISDHKVRRIVYLRRKYDTGTQ
jgi:hypothetical protein